METLRAGQAGWYPVARSAELGGKRPLRRFLFGRPVVVFGKPATPHVLDDRCPHRSAALSGGRVVDGMVECPFHGWKLDGDGACRAIPSHTGELPRRSARAHRAVSRHGLVFVAVGEPTGGPVPPALLDGTGYVHIWSGLDVSGRLGEVAENFLDVTHTFTVHPHLIRGTKADTPSRVEVRGKPNEVEVGYYGEGRPAGLAARLFEGERSASIGRFVGPNAAIVEFHGPKGPRIAVTSYLVPTEEGKVGGFAVVVVPGPRWAGFAKFALLRPIAGIVNRQDIRILNATARNQALFGNPPHARSPTDYVLRDIEAILDGIPPDSAGRTVVYKALL
jgi:phenylpropionate dioxygenase-like ring-hydroxylating dioxygenase large terminal subunit